MVPFGCGAFDNFFLAAQMDDSSVYQERVGLGEGGQEETLDLEGGSSLGLELAG